MSAVGAACIASLLPALAQGASPKSPLTWAASWASSQQLPEPENALKTDDLDHAVLRQIVHLSLGGPQVRVELSNEFGTQPLTIVGAHIARAVSPAASAIDPATDHALTFNGLPGVTIPAGAKYLSDSLPVPVDAQEDLAITLQLDAAPAHQTGHMGSRATSYLAHDVALDAKDMAQATHFDHWYFLAAVLVASPQPATTVVALGDSITDGHGSTLNGNNRWPDLLAVRLQQAKLAVGVANEGIGGNRLLLDGLGPNVLARFDRDVLVQPGVRSVIVLEGVNDLGTATRTADISPEAHADLVARILGAYTQIVERAHEHGLLVYLATITPYVGSDYYHPGPASEADRQTINAWIRATGHADGCIDFDKAIADPAHPDRLLAAYDSGDHLHPSPVGYQAMANAVPLGLTAIKGAGR